MSDNKLQIIISIVLGIRALTEALVHHVSWNVSIIIGLVVVCVAIWVLRYELD